MATLGTGHSIVDRESAKRGIVLVQLPLNAVGTAAILADAAANTFSKGLVGHCRARLIAPGDRCLVCLRGNA